MMVYLEDKIKRSVRTRRNKHVLLFHPNVILVNNYLTLTSSVR